MNVHLEKNKGIYMLKYEITINDRYAGNVWIHFLINGTQYIPIVAPGVSISEHQLVESLCKRQNIGHHIQSVKEMAKVLDKLKWEQMDNIEMNGFYDCEEYIDVEFGIKGLNNYIFSVCFKNKELIAFCMFDESTEELIELAKTAIPKQDEIICHIIHSSIYRLHFLMHGFH